MCFISRNFAYLSLFGKVSEHWVLDVVQVLVFIVASVHSPSTGLLNDISLLTINQI
ncbi:hypothetical protein M23134_08154 [Microscilla marina ATCC 23134]|uniref:Uncharacterized protein n=1 Tax=Microscilla marina ATCC 23134 TaxID=313606 RepID=A1ZH56_MICM2|nr:hypothetical protein M23134_08154 [Microscilla marina ATCC 23134]